MEGIIYSKFEIRKSKLARGFSLAEIIIILGIIGIIISGILPMFLNVIASGKSSSYYSTAYKVADSQVESYRNENFDTLASEDFDLTELPEGHLTTIVSNEIDGNNETDIKKISLVVSWNYKRNQEVKIVTYIYRNGL